MSFTINHVSLVGGNLVRDAEMKYTGGGTPVLNFDIALNRSWRNRESGEIQEEVSYFKVNYWGKPAESVQKFLTKGKKVAIEGRLQQRRWEGQDGKTNSIVEIVASSVILMGGMSSDNNFNANSQPQQSQPQQQSQQQSWSPQPQQGQQNQQNNFGNNPPQPDFSPGSNFTDNDVPF